MQYSDLSLKDCGSLEKYGEELLRLYKHLPEGYATEAALIDRLILGVGQEEVTRQYRKIRPKTYSAAMELVRVWAKPPRKATKLLHTDTKPPKKKSAKKSTKGKSKKSVNTIQNVVCTRCGRPGHYATQCRSSRVFRCGLCGLTGHYTRQCPNLPDDLKEKFNGLYSRNISPNIGTSSKTSNVPTESAPKDSPSNDEESKN